MMNKLPTIIYQASNWLKNVVYTITDQHIRCCQSAANLNGNHHNQMH